MRKVLIAAFVLLQFSTAMAEEVLSRSLFNFEPRMGDIKRMQVDLVSRSGRHFARVKSLLREGGSRTGELVCTKLQENEFRCNRDDGAGGFVLNNSSRPSITISNFYGGDEEDSAKATLALIDGSSFTVNGSNSVISKKDAF